MTTALDGTDRRPRWRKKRWRAGVAAWLAFPVVYPLSAGPADYGVMRGWLPAGPVRAAYAPVWAVARLHPRAADAMNSYCFWWSWQALDIPTYPSPY